MNSIANSKHPKRVTVLFGIVGTASGLITTLIFSGELGINYSIGGLIFAFAFILSLSLSTLFGWLSYTLSKKRLLLAYPEMYDKRVEATGTLRFYHDPTPIDETIISQRAEDHYYFEYEITQVRLVPNHRRVKLH